MVSLIIPTPLVRSKSKREGILGHAIQRMRVLGLYRVLKVFLGLPCFEDRVQNNKTEWPKKHHCCNLGLGVDAS